MRRLTKRNKKGGRKIGEGSFGKVFSPPLRCVDEGGKTYGEGFVSKILSGSDVEEEYENSMKVRALDPEGMWSVTPERACKLSDSQENANYVKGAETYQIIYRHGGLSLYDLLLKPGVVGKAHLYVQGMMKQGEEDSSVFELLDPDGLSRLINGVKGILGGLDTLNLTYIHGDLHLGNIVYDGHRSRLIDFASLTDVRLSVQREEESFKKCVLISAKDPHCQQHYSMLFDRLIDDRAGSRDIITLWTDLRNLLNSEWVNRVFPERFAAWFQKHQKRVDNGFRSDYVYAIMDCPA